MKTGVVLMTYGSPRDLDDVGAYMTRVRGGRQPDADLLQEFRRRYDVIGLSPLIEITQLQASRLAKALGSQFAVAAGMRFSEPSVATAVAQLRSSGAEQILGVILSPQYSPTLMGGYGRALDEAAGGLPTRTVGAWHLNPSFVDVLASRIRGSLAQFDAVERTRVPVLLTAHSLPKRVVDSEPDYIEQLKATARAVAQTANLAPEQWSFVYQSAGHTPEEWLKPDLLDVLPDIARDGHTAVVVAPVQFLADHLETLYDIDVGGREQAAEAGITTFVRVNAPNADPDFIDALRDVVLGDLAVWNVGTRGVAWTTV
ncbi:MAG: ferrochelatase [Chloroflexota bacterium]